MTLTATPRTSRRYPLPPCPSSRLSCVGLLSNYDQPGSLMWAVDPGATQGWYWNRTRRSGWTVWTLLKMWIAAAQRELVERGHGTRFELHVGDIREWLQHSDIRFDLIMLLNNIYYFEAARRQEVYQELANSLTDRGQLLVVSMTTPRVDRRCSSRLHAAVSGRHRFAPRSGRSANRPAFGWLRDYRRAEIAPRRAARRCSGHAPSRQLEPSGGRRHPDSPFGACFDR